MQAFDLIVALKRFCADTIENEKWGSEVPIVLLDMGMNPVYQMTARKNSSGVYEFDEEHLAPGTVRRPPPYTVQFTVGGAPILRDFDFPA